MGIRLQQKMSVAKNKELQIAQSKKIEKKWILSLSLIPGLIHPPFYIAATQKIKLEKRNIVRIELKLQQRVLNIFFYEPDIYPYLYHTDIASKYGIDNFDKDVSNNAVFSEKKI